MAIEDKLLEIAAYTLPAFITGGVAFVMMQKFYNSEESKRKYELLRENQKQALPIRLQAYERIVLFLRTMHAYYFNYIGLLGPSAKRDRVLQELKDQGIEFSAEQIKHIYGPTGLALGAETSAEIALSVCAEIMAVMESRLPVHLRDQLTPIHSKL